MKLLQDHIDLITHTFEEVLKFKIHNPVKMEIFRT